MNVRTTWWICLSDVRCIFSENNSEAPGEALSLLLNFSLNHWDSRIQMPVNMTMQEPRTRIVCLKSECDVVSTSANAHNVSANWIFVVVCGASRNPHNIESVSMKMEGMLWSVNHLVLVADMSVLNNLHFHLLELIPRLLCLRGGCRLNHWEAGLWLPSCH